MALVALHALGIATGRLANFSTQSSQKHAFDEVRPFMVRLFEKASDNGVRIILPVDFQCSAKPVMAQKSEKPSSVQVTGESGPDLGTGDKDKEKFETVGVDSVEEFV